MPLRRVLLPTTAALTLIAAAPAAAAALWAPPELAARGDVVAPQLAFTAGGIGVGSVRTLAGSAAVTVAPGGPTTSRRVRTIEDGPLPYARGATISLRRRAVGQRTALGYSFGRADGTIGAVRALRTVQLRPSEAELAVAPNGAAVIAFADERNGSTRVWLATRRAGSSRFSTPAVVRGSGSARSLAVSINARGRYVLAYTFGLNDRRTVEARIGTAGGAVGTLQRVGDQLGRATVDAVVAPTGRTTVAWTTHDLGEEQNDPTQLRTNVAPAGRTTFAGQVVLDRAAPGALSTEPLGPSLAAAPDGTTAVGYTLSGRNAGDDVRTPARVSVQDRDARFGAPQELAADGVVGRIAASSDGTFAVPFVTGAPLEPAASPLFVALKRPDGTRFAAEQVTARTGVESAAAFGPDDEATVLYELPRNEGAAVSRRKFP